MSTNICDPLQPLARLYSDAKRDFDRSVRPLAQRLSTWLIRQFPCTSYSTCTSFYAYLMELHKNPMLGIRIRDIHAIQNRFPHEEELKDLVGNICIEVSPGVALCAYMYYNILKYGLPSATLPHMICDMIRCIGARRKEKHSDYLSHRTFTDIYCDTLKDCEGCIPVGKPNRKKKSRVTYEDNKSALLFECVCRDELLYAPVALRNKNNEKEKRMYALVDTSSKCSLLQMEVVEQLQLCVRKTDRTNVDNVVGETDVLFKLVDDDQLVEEVIVTLYVVCSLSSPPHMVLGLDIMCRQKYMLFPGEKQLCVYEYEYESRIMRNIIPLRHCCCEDPGSSQTHRSGRNMVSDKPLWNGPSCWKEWRKQWTEMKTIMVELDVRMIHQNAKYLERVKDSLKNMHMDYEDAIEWIRTFPKRYKFRHHLLPLRILASCMTDDELTKKIRVVDVTDKAATFGIQIESLRCAHCVLSQYFKKFTTWWYIGDTDMRDMEVYKTNMVMERSNGEWIYWRVAACREQEKEELICLLTRLHQPTPAYWIKRKKRGISEICVSQETCSKRRVTEQGWV
jgi:hypothetical protein